MAIEKSVRYSNMVDAKTRESLVLKDGVIFNNRYEGSAKAGAVKVRKTGAVSVVDYDPATGAKLNKEESQYITITIDKDKAVNELIDGYEAAAVTDNMVAERVNDAGFAIALTLDADGAACLVAEGTAFGDTAAITADTAYGVAVDTRTAMSKANVPNDGQRYMIVSPDAYAAMLKSPEFVKASDLGDKVVQTGAVGAIAGFNVYESNNLGDGVDFVAGHPLFATRVNEWAVDVHVQDLAQSGTFIGACAVQGRKVYAHKVTNPAAILVKKSA